MHTIYPVAIESDKALTSSFDSVATHCLNYTHLVYYVFWSALTGAGSLKIQGGMTINSIDHWSDLDADPLTISGSSGNGVFHIQCAGLQKTRLVYTNSTGSAGTVDITLTAVGSN
jgi:hypothetical protein